MVLVCNWNVFQKLTQCDEKSYFELLRRHFAVWQPEPAHLDKGVSIPAAVPTLLFQGPFKNYHLELNSWKVNDLCPSHLIVIGALPCSVSCSWGPGLEDALLPAHCAFLPQGSVSNTSLALLPLWGGEGGYWNCALNHNDPGFHFSKVGAGSWESYLMTRAACASSFSRS